MKLYYSKGACSLAVRIILHELGIKADYESVDLKTKKTQKGQDFLKINPKGAVPVLVLENTEVLTENAAIQQYLADSNKATQLLPAVGKFERYRVLEWLNFVSTDLHKGCGPLFNSAVPEDIKETIFKPILKNKLVFINESLQGKEYLMGDTFTLPDAYLFVVLRWMGHLGIDINRWPNLVNYFGHLKSRKSIAQALQEEGLK